MKKTDIFPSNYVKAADIEGREVTVVIADANLRAQLASHSPELWQVIKARRDYMRTALGIVLPEEVLPLSLANGRYAPAWLQPDMVWVNE